MAIFTRRRQVRVEPGYWFTQESEPLVAEAGEMDDDGCLSEAYGAQFWLAPEAVSCLTIWAYAAPLGSDDADGFFVGYCVEYAAGHGEWDARLYYGGELAEWYESVQGAADAARAAAIDLLNDQDRVSQEVIAEWFDWDGEPFSTEDNQ